MRLDNFQKDIIDVVLRALIRLFNKHFSRTQVNQQKEIYVLKLSKPAWIYDFWTLLNILIQNNTRI